MRRCLVGVILALILAQSSHAQTRRTAAGVDSTRSTLQVYLVTLGEGELYWEKFGHNALWFFDPAKRVNVVFNWGTFDFNEPGYLRRLLIGDNRYWVDTVAAGPFMDFYRSYDRSIVVQRLNLTPQQAEKAFAYSLWNAREENKYYRYDYFRDNCSTRVRDVIDLAVGGALKQSTQALVKRTYRTETLRLVDDMKLTQFGIDVALGRPADNLVTLWQDMFVPSRLRDALRDVSVARADGSTVPLVAEERTVYESRNHAERTDFPRMWPAYLIVGLLLAGELILVGKIGERSRGADVVFRVEAGLFAFLCGVLGLVVLLAWLITQHVFWYTNENLLALNPLSLWLCISVLLSIWKRHWTRRAAIVAIVVAMATALGLLLKGGNIFPQNNVPLLLLLLPPHMAVAYGLWRRSTATTPVVNA